MIYICIKFSRVNEHDAILPSQLLVLQESNEVTRDTLFSRYLRTAYKTVLIGSNCANFPHILESY